VTDYTSCLAKSSGRHRHTATYHTQLRPTVNGRPLHVTQQTFTRSLLTMTATPPGKITLPPGPSPSELFDTSSPYSTGASHSRRPRQSFSTAGRARRDSFDDVPKLPTLVPGIRPAYSTSLPMLPMVVLCIVSRRSCLF
jgi:hypothetical protein